MTGYEYLGRHLRRWATVIFIVLTTITAVILTCTATTPDAEVTTVQQGAVPIAARDVTGVSWSPAMPLGLVGLLVLALVFNHRREMQRIKQNETRKESPNGSRASYSQGDSEEET